MLQLVFDWEGGTLGREERVQISGDAGLPVCPGPAETRSQMGVRFQREEFQKLLDTIGHWKSIEFFTMGGDPVESVDDLPKGKDGGIDAIIRITTATEHGAKNVAGRIRNILVRQAYARR
jgi:hypothetical protein